jgi:hypothetical protein
MTRAATSNRFRLLSCLRQLAATSPVILGSALVCPRQAGARRRLDARRLRELRQEVLVALARVAPHDAAQCRIGFQRRGVDADDQRNVLRSAVGAFEILDQR